MRVFDEYWLSLGDDGRKNKKPKKFFFEKNQVKGPDIEVIIEYFCCRSSITM